MDIAVTIPQRIFTAKGEGLLVLLGNTKGTLERNILDPMREIWSPDLVGNISSDNTVKLFGKKVYALGADNKKHMARILFFQLLHHFRGECAVVDYIALVVDIHIARI